MLHNALVFLAGAFVAGVLGFTGLAGTPLVFAQILCGLLVFLCAVSLFMLRRDGV